MQPIVQTLEVMADLDLEDGSDLFRVLSSQSVQMHSLVPDVVGMSVGTVEHDLTLTFAATNAELAVLDLSPRLLDAPDHARGHILDEGRWQRLAQATAAAAVSSTLWSHHALALSVYGRSKAMVMWCCTSKSAVPGAGLIASPARRG